MEGSYKNKNVPNHNTKDLSQKWHNPSIMKTGSQWYVCGELSIGGRVYANILIGHVEFRLQ